MSTSREIVSFNPPSANMMYQAQLAREAENVHRDEEVAMARRQDAEIGSEGMESELCRDNERQPSRVSTLKYFRGIMRQYALKIWQGASIFKGKMTLQDQATLNQGNELNATGCEKGQIEQIGSTFEADITAGRESKIRQGNTISI